MAHPGRVTISERRSTQKHLTMSLCCLLVVALSVSLVACGDSDDARSVAPAIASQPANQTVNVGTTATFTANATGTAPLHYQWYKGSTAVSGATAASYTTPATVSADNAAQFKVTVSNAVGSITSAAATLTVSGPVASGLACAPGAPAYGGTSALVPTFSGGTGVIGSSGAGSSDIAASAVSGHSYTSPALSSAKTYTLTVTALDAEVATTSCVVTPTTVSVSSISPATPVMGPGQQRFSANASGGLTNNLTWSASGGTFNAGVWSSPTTAGSYTITATSVDEPSISSSTTATVSLPVITTQPVSHNLCPGGGTILSVTADYAQSYQWSLTGTAISGATNPSYNIPAAASGDAGVYTAAVSNAAGTSTSNVAKIVVGSSLTSNPKSLSIFATQTATFSVAADGQVPFSYQWYLIPSGGSTGAAIPSATSSTYTTPAVDTSYNGDQYYATVGDSCGGSALTSSSATLTVTGGNVPPTITTQPVGQAVTAGSTPTFSAVASGTPALSYQWYSIPAGTVGGNPVAGANASSYTLPDTATTPANDQDAYYVMVSNAYGQAVSQSATLAVGSGILLQITGQPATVYVNDGAAATFSVTASSSLPLSYQWYRADSGSSTFTAIAGATSATYTLNTTSASDTGAVFYAVVSNGGATAAVTSNSAALFVGTLAGVNDLCSTTWSALGNASPLSGCAFQLTAATGGQYGEIVWPTLISTANIQLSFTVTISNPSSPPADGFAMVLGDPSLGATPTSAGFQGSGLGAEGIPGFVLGFDTYENAGDPPVPYLGVGRGEPALWENPWMNVNTNIPPLAVDGSTIAHDYTVSIVKGQMTVTMDGTQVFSGNVTVPSVAYLYFTASTGGLWEEADISNLAATVSTP